MSKPKSNHFVPRFYLQSWCDSDEKLLVSRRDSQGRLTQTRSLRKNVGAQNRLYALRHVPPKEEMSVETDFFTAQIDTPASKVHEALLSGNNPSLTPQQRITWARFLLSLRIRHPQSIQEIKQHADSIILSHLKDVPKYATLAAQYGVKEKFLFEFTQNPYPSICPQNMAMDGIRSILSNDDAIGHIVRMYWVIKEVSRADTLLLSCDRPASFYPHHLDDPQCFIFLPLSPRVAFFAAHDSKLISLLEEAHPNNLIKSCNKTTVLRAAREVYGDGSERLIDKWLGKKEATPCWDFRT